MSTSWAATPIPLPTDPPRHPSQQPGPEVLPIPVPEPPRYEPAPASAPAQMSEPMVPREMIRRPPPPAATPITLP